MKIWLDDSLLDGKSYENVLIYDISYKTLTGAKPLLIKFDKIDGFIRVYEGTRYFISFDAIYDKIRNSICQKSDIIYIYLHYYTKIKIYWHDYLPLKKS